MFIEGFEVLPCVLNNSHCPARKFIRSTTLKAYCYLAGCPHDISKLSAICTETASEWWYLTQRSAAMKALPTTFEHLHSPPGPMMARQISAHDDDFLVAISGLRMTAKPVNCSHMAAAPQSWRNVPGLAETPISKLTRRLLKGLRKPHSSAATPIAAVALNGKPTVSDVPPVTAHDCCACRTWLVRTRPHTPRTCGHHNIFLCSSAPRSLQKRTSCKLNTHV